MARSSPPSREERKEEGDVPDFDLQAIDEFANSFIEKKCEQIHEDVRPFAAFILNVSGVLQMVSFAMSTKIESADKKVKMAKDEVTDTNPQVLARRGLVRFLIKEAKKAEVGGVFSVIRINDDGEFELSPKCRLYMYSTHAHICHSVVMGDETRVPHDANNCMMNKNRRWNLLGVQGALLSNTFAPVFISKVVYGESPPIDVDLIRNLLFGQLGVKGRDMSYGSLHKLIHPTRNDRTIVWFQGLTGYDVIDETGRLEEGNGPSVCREEIFKAYLQLSSANKSIVKYSKAKKAAKNYQKQKIALYKKWEAEKNGKWLNRQSNKLDKFVIE